MSSDVKSRYDAPPPRDVHRYPIDPDDSGFHDGASETVEIEADYYPAPLASYLGKHVSNGDIVVDVGCGKHPIFAKILESNALVRENWVGDDLSSVRVVALDGRNIDAISGNVVKTIGDTRRFLLVACDLNRLNGDTLSQNGKRRPECAKRLDSLQEFLADKGDVGSAQADVLFFGNILHSIDLGEPVDFLLDKVRTGGKIVIAGTPDIRLSEDQRPPEGRRMADFRRYLEAEGHKVLSHEYCGYVLTEARLRRIGEDVAISKISVPSILRKGSRVSDESLVDFIIKEIVEAGELSSDGVRFGSFGIGGDFRLRSTGHTKLGRYDKEPVGRYVSIPMILAPAKPDTDKRPQLLMFAPQEVIVAEKARLTRKAEPKPPRSRLKHELAEARERVRQLLLALRESA